MNILALWVFFSLTTGIVLGIAAWRLLNVRDLAGAPLLIALVVSQSAHDLAQGLLLAIAVSRPPRADTTDLIVIWLLSNLLTSVVTLFFALYTLGIVSDGRLLRLAHRAEIYLRGMGKWFR